MEKERFDQLFRTYYFMVFRVAFAQMKNQTDAEDAAQEVFVRLMKYNPDFKNKNHEKAWFLRTAINLCHDMEKSKWKRTTVYMEQVPEREKAYMKSPFPDEDDTLWAVLETEKKYRNPLYLFYYEDYSVREISEILKIPENTVKTYLRRGREAVKEKLKRS